LLNQNFVNLVNRPIWSDERMAGFFPRFCGQDCSYASENSQSELYAFDWSNQRLAAKNVRSIALILWWYRWGCFWIFLKKNRHVAKP
jgi:hypothetical protein